MWIPSLNFLLKIQPLPMGPCLFEVHVIEAVRFPSSGSVAVPEKRMVVFVATFKPFVGLPIRMTGGRLTSGGPEVEET